MAHQGPGLQHQADAEADLTFFIPEICQFLSENELMKVEMKARKPFLKPLLAGLAAGGLFLNVIYWTIGPASWTTAATIFISLWVMALAERRLK
ncbi:MAG: hypothetical protein O9972_16040 [Burkholderiales bacterium]|jgi:hypothetical protein|nr:hypothetical protein [Burkholderiales bacterium]